MEKARRKQNAIRQRDDVSSDCVQFVYTKISYSWPRDISRVFLAATKQLYEWFSPSVRPSHLFDYVPIIVSSWNFQELLRMTKVMSMQKVKVKGQGHRGHDPFSRFRTVTPVWIHILRWNDAYSLMLVRRGALLFFKVIRQISRSHG